MSLQDQIKKDLAVAMKTKDQEKTSVLRVIMGEFGRHPSKEIEDSEALKIIKKLVKSEKEVLAQSGGGQSNRFVEVCETYLPKLTGEQEIRSWIEANIDFSQFKNKMQAMGDIMKHFGDKADGNMVKKVLMSM